MEPSSRTPEGEWNRCPVCGNEVRLEPSRPPGDAPCPRCGCLLWFGPKGQSPEQQESAAQIGSPRQAEFTLSDFRKRLSQMRKLSPLPTLVGMLPGGDALTAEAEAEADKNIRQMLGIIDAVTPEERRNPERVVDCERRRRIAKGAGVSPDEVDVPVAQFAPMAEVMKRISGGVRDRM